MYKNVLIIDNFDSFTFNLVDYFRQLGCQVQIYRNTVSPEELRALEFDLMVLSPGPSVPRNAGNLMQIIEAFYQTRPIFGVCLGLQALVEFFGGSLQFLEPVHGKPDRIIHDGKSIYQGLPVEIEMGRYHSLAADVVPSVFEVTARNADGVVMSLRHRQLPIEAVQYHPESVLSMREDAGFRLIRNVVQGNLSTGNVAYFRLMRQMMEEETLGAEDIRLFVELIHEGQLTEDQKLVLLVSISSRLKNPVALSRLVQALLAYSSWESRGFAEDAIDICGTGGSNLPRLNTSTLAGLTLAALGVPIVKHGNRAASGRFGSFDLLEALGVDLHAGAAQVASAAQQTGLGFIFAPKAHPVVGAFGSSRARLGIPTLFNTLGPLLNPLQPKRQFIGTAFAPYMDLIADTAAVLGRTHVVVARGADGLDEITLTGPTRLVSIRGTRREHLELEPADFGLQPLPFEALKCENPAQSLELANQILDGQPQTLHYQLVAVNAAYIYSTFYQEIPLREAYMLMEDTIRSGRLRQVLNAYIKVL
ncbi:MAG: anthranilate phosphoribosyltransferase [Bacteroidetes bacterium]|nr:anthranilate phosphoribosyltransferase [Bacteroidota bacterium]